MLHRLPFATQPNAQQLSPLSPDLIDEAIGIMPGADGLSGRQEVLAYVAEHLPDKIGEKSRDRFARYLVRPYFIDGELDHAALQALGSQVPEATKRHIALLQLAWTEPVLAAFLEECLPDPGWRRFTVRGLGNWVTAKRGSEDRTTVYRLIGALKRGGYLRPFDRAWLVSPPRLTALTMFLGVMREEAGPGRTTLAALFSTATLRRTGPRADTVFEILRWAAHHEIIRWRGPGEATVWLPYDREETVDRIIEASTESLSRSAI